MSITKNFFYLETLEFSILNQGTSFLARVDMPYLHVGRLRKEGEENKIDTRKYVTYLTPR